MKKQTERLSNLARDITYRRFFNNVLKPSWEKGHLLNLPRSNFKQFDLEQLHVGEQISDKGHSNILNLRQKKSIPRLIIKQIDCTVILTISNSH